MALCFLLPLASFAQGTRIKADLVPESVLKGYADKYKKRKVKTWYEEESGYSAVFEKGDLRPRAYFTHDGEWIRTTLAVKDKSVSYQVKKAIKNTQWSDWKITDRYRVETPEYPKLFELHMKKGKEKKVFLFDPTGKALEIH
jgi:hypothetical protein